MEPLDLGPPTPHSGSYSTAGGGEAGPRLGLRLVLLVAPPLLFLEPTQFPPPLSLSLIFPLQAPG